MVIVAADFNGYVGKISNGFDRHQKQTKVDYILTRRPKDLKVTSKRSLTTKDVSSPTNL